MRSDWDTFVRSARNGHFFFQRGYLEYHVDRFQDASLVIRSRNTIVAVLAANVNGDTLVSHEGLTYGGFLVGEDMTASRMIGVLEVVLDYLRGLRLRRVVYKAIPHIYHREPSEEDLYALHLARAKVFRRDLSSALLLAERPGYSKGKKLNLARAKKAGLTVVRSNDFGAFMRLLDSVLEERHGVRPVHTAAEMELLASRFPENIRLYCGHLGGELTAGALIFLNPLVAHTQYLANSPAGREVGALDFLIDTLLNNEFSDCRYFSFGISTEDEGKRLNEGLLHSKEAFGARAIVHDFYELSL
jgi:hypothetical protein